MRGSGETPNAPIIDIKPDPASIVVRSLSTLGLAAIVVVAVQVIGGRWAIAPYDDYLTWLAVAVLLVRFGWEVLVYLSRRYTLSREAVTSATGVFTRHVNDIAVDRVQHVVLRRSLIERLTGLGSLGFSSSGTAWPEVVWIMIARPGERLEEIRGVLRGRSPSADGVRRARPVVIGMAGGIGAGKSAVAQELEKLGCVVLDSDEQAKRVLQEPGVRDELVSWWGKDILDEAGRVDRGKVAGIVFNDAEQRKRLEGLIHPRLKRDRATMIAEAGEARAVVIDAPLLFEAGVDAECDAVLFVDSPREQRLARVIEHRGWDEAEFDRRERAQWSPERKRARSDEVIVNDGDRAELARRTREALQRVLDRADADGGASRRDRPAGAGEGGTGS
ncbi:MAG: dephospho-CoA kinase [Phycisphaerales bacterium JB037]